jgi:hypothetical protein
MIKVRDSMDMLRRDALARGMLDLAAVYGWSEIRINTEIIDQQMKQRAQYQQVADEWKKRQSGRRSP